VHRRWIIGLAAPEDTAAPPCSALQLPFAYKYPLLQPPIYWGYKLSQALSYGPPWAHYLGGYQDRLLGGPLGLPGLRYTIPEGVEHKDYIGVVLG
jgi:hypothetical protein